MSNLNKIILLIILGEKPVTKTKDNKILVKDIVNNIKDIVVFNDEAHHIHDKKLAWNRTIENINNNLVQKNSKLPLQIDVTATPKHQNGNILFKLFPTIH